MKRDLEIAAERISALLFWTSLFYGVRFVTSRQRGLVCLVSWKSTRKETAKSPPECTEECSLWEMNCAQLFLLAGKVAMELQLLRYMYPCWIAGQATRFCVAGRRKKLDCMSQMLSPQRKTKIWSFSPTEAFSSLHAFSLSGSPCESSSPYRGNNAAQGVGCSWWVVIITVRLARIS